MVEEFFLETDELAFDVVHTAHLVYLVVGFKIESHEPGPCGTLMVCDVAVFLASDVVGVIVSALRGE